MQREEQTGKSELMQFVRNMDCLQMKMMVNSHSRETKPNATESVKEWYFHHCNFVTSILYLQIFSNLNHNCY